jgi:predicted nucleic acid-binding protein
LKAIRRSPETPSISRFFGETVPFDPEGIDPDRMTPRLPMYLLDTNVVSELRRPRPHGAVLAWLERVADPDLHLSAVTIGEIQAGIEITRERDHAKAAEIELWLEQVAATYNVLPMDARTFRVWARLMHRRSDHLIEDAMIAATALVHDLIVVTRNVADFDPLGVRTLNPFEARTP